MNFDEAVRYLLSLGHETVAIKLGLDNIERLLGRLGRPQDSFTSVQIAGTNGKGSTASMLASIARAAGVSAGLYTSPHLVSITERVRLSGEEISREDFARAASSVRAACEEIERATGALPTFFEQLTAIALDAFRDAGVRLAILETGLGGRLDATTAARASVVAVTPVALDHQEYLGETLAEIASEKAAIIRAGVKAVLAPQEAEAGAALLARCRECGVGPRFAGDDFEILDADGGGRLRIRLRTARADYGVVRLSLRGRHQLVNASVTVALAEALAEDGFPFEPAAVAAGLESAVHEGRLELDAGRVPPMLFDGAHNPAGARALRQYLDEFVAGPLTLVFGAMRDKALGEIGATLFPAAAQLILTSPQHPRAAAVEELVRAVPVPPSSSTITLAPSSADALRLAFAQTPHGGTVCVTGSLYLVGEVKGLLAHSTTET